MTTLCGTLTVIGHGENGDLGDGTVSALDSAGSLVQRRQICVEVTGVTSSTWHLLSGSRDLSQSVGVTISQLAQRSEGQ